MCFWKKGLHFSCTQCGRCCRGEPGIVFFNPREFDALAKHLEETRGITREELIRDYMRPWMGSYTARDDFPDGHCIFYEHGCTVYAFRPSQCRDFPFWRCNLAGKTEWDEAARTCPGMNRGKLWSEEEIREIATGSRL